MTTWHVEIEMPWLCWENAAFPHCRFVGSPFVLQAHRKVFTWLQQNRALPLLMVQCYDFWQYLHRSWLPLWSAAMAATLLRSRGCAEGSQFSWHGDIVIFVFFCEISLWIPNWHGTPQNTFFAKANSRIRGLRCWSSSLILCRWMVSISWILCLVPCESCSMVVRCAPSWVTFYLAHDFGWPEESWNISVSYWYCLTIKLSKI